MLKGIQAWVALVAQLVGRGSRSEVAQVYKYRQRGLTADVTVNTRSFQANKSILQAKLPSRDLRAAV